MLRLIKVKVVPNLRTTPITILIANSSVVSMETGTTVIIIMVEMEGVVDKAGAEAIIALYVSRKFGHTALVCYHCFEKEFSLAAGQGRGNAGSSSNNNSNPTAFVATQVSNPFVATPETVVDPNWYVDSGATNHVTVNYNNLTNSMDYGGTELVTIGNGEKLHISYTGHSYLCDGTNMFKLQNVLCVPDIAKNLISVSKLAQDNSIFIELYGDCCLIKDKATCKTLVRGELDDGLYRLNRVQIVKDGRVEGK